MTDQKQYRDSIIKELWDKKIVVAIVNQHAYQWNIPKETEICDDAIQHVFLVLSKMSHDKLIELYEYDNTLYKLKNYIGAIVRTACFGRNEKVDNKPSYSLINKILYTSVLQSGNEDSDSFKDVWVDDQYSEDTYYKDLWNEKVLPRLTDDEKDFLNVWFAIKGTGKPKRYKYLYNRLVVKIKNLAQGLPLSKERGDRKYSYKLTDEEKEELLFAPTHGLKGRPSNNKR